MAPLILNFFRTLLRIKKNISEADARIIAFNAVKEIGKEKLWKEPVRVFEYASFYRLTAGPQTRGNLYVIVDVESGRVRGIGGPMDC